MTKSYTELEVWKASRALVNDVYGLTKTFPKEEVFGLSSQLRRCVVSVPSNIAEGIGRNHSKDTIQFLFVARGSLYEVETQLYLASDQRYFDNAQLNTLLEQITRCKQLLNGLINHYEKRPN